MDYDEAKRCVDAIADYMSRNESPLAARDIRQAAQSFLARGKAEGRKEALEELRHMVTHNAPRRNDKHNGRSYIDTEWITWAIGKLAVPLPPTAKRKGGEMKLWAVMAGKKLLTDPWGFPAVYFTRKQVLKSLGFLQDGWRLVRVTLPTPEPDGGEG